MNGWLYLLMFAVWAALVFCVMRLMQANKEGGLDTAWQETRKTLDRLGANVPEPFLSGQNDPTGARNVAARPPTRTLRGDISRVSAHFKRTTRTKSSRTSTPPISNGFVPPVTRKRTQRRRKV